MFLYELRTAHTRCTNRRGLLGSCKIQNHVTKNDVPEYTMKEAIKLIGHAFKIKK